MTQPKKHLDDLFGSVANDTPSIANDELRSLLEQKTSGNIPMSSVQTTIINEDRRRGFYKREIIIMTLIGVFFTSILLLFSARQENKLTNKTIALGVQNQTHSESVSAPLQISEYSSETQVSKNNDSLKYLGFDPVDLSCVTPVQITTEDMNRIGFLSGENGDMVFYHASTSVSFPMSEKIKTHTIGDDGERVSRFKNISFHPTFATDSRGNLLFIYKYKNDKDGERTTTSFGDDNDEVTKLLNSNYIPVQSISSEGGNVDSSHTPWIITSHYHIRLGIMGCDTTMSRKKGVEDLWTPIQPIINSLRAKDSIYKSQFGGEPGLRLRFEFPYESKKLTKFERSIQDSLTVIENRYTSRKQQLVAQQSYLSRVAETNLPDTTKLMLEQLGRKIAYEGYILAHQEEEKEFANITSLVPIKVRENTGMKADGKYDNGLIFWYEPSKELFATLPELQQKLSAEACTPSLEHRLTGVSLYPNPARMYLFLNYSLAASAKVSVSILDLSGKIINNVVTSHEVGAGLNKESITLGDIPPGVYIVLLSTDSGERNIQRLVITK